MSTRIEKLIPDLVFSGKEEKENEFGLLGVEKKDLDVWRQLETQAHLADEQLENTTNEFTSWINSYEELKEMVVVQKGLNVISSFGRLLIALDSEKQFLLSILKDYLDKRRIMEEKLREYTKEEVQQERIMKISFDKERRNDEIYERYKTGEKVIKLARMFSLSQEQIRNILVKVEAERKIKKEVEDTKK